MTIANLFMYPKFRGQDANGNALAGGKLYSYEEGSSTPKTTYSDAARTVPNTNPVVLDTNGEAIIYIDGLYKFVLKDSNDVVQWTVDQVSGSVIELTGDQTIAGVKTFSSSPIVPTPTTDYQASTKEYVDTYVDTYVSTYVDTYAIPVGSIVSVAMETPPTNFLECDGSTISRTTYADLFSAIGDVFGVGDGSTTFEIPDLRGYFLRGWDHGAAVDPDAATRTDSGDGTTGDHVGTKQTGVVESHLHSSGTLATSSDGAHTHTIIPGTPNEYSPTRIIVESALSLGTLATSSDGAHTHTISGNTGSTGDNETRPKNINVMYCIKY